MSTPPNQRRKRWRNVETALRAGHLSVPYGGLGEVLFRLVLVAPAPHLVAAVTRSRHPLFDHVLGDCFEVVGPADPGEEVDESGRDVQAIFSELGGFVVPGEGVVVVVETFAEGEEGDELVFGGADVSGKK